MENILINFGFHSTMVKWIMQCITSSKFSICLNGGIHGYFRGGRGLRQGDPISPYLFTLVMEVFNLIMIKNIAENKDFGYHFGCKELKLSHICFADDFLVLCKGNKESLQVIKQSLEEFAKVYGLDANLRKSVIFFGSIKDEVKRELLQILPFKCGKLPVRYLGAPLLAKRLSVQDCKVLLDKLYWAYVYLLPNTIIKDIDKMFKMFLWNSGESARGKARIAWKMVCRPKEEGGLIGKVDYVSVWYDKRSPNGPLGNFITQRNIYDARLYMDAKIHQMIIDNRLPWPNEWPNLFLDLQNISMPKLNEKEDKVLWVTNAGLKSTRNEWNDTVKAAVEREVIS
ncbi:RNA-directed DNA polymerase, eukaryota, reverse transcriptase zinc-binding domain protein [Tanacetum coccineum]